MGIIEWEGSYNYIVVEKIISLIFLDDFGLPFQLRLEAISDIGTTGLNIMLKIVQGLEDAMLINQGIMSMEI